MIETFAVERRLHSERRHFQKGKVGIARCDFAARLCRAEEIMNSRFKIALGASLAILLSTTNLLLAQMTPEQRLKQAYEIEKEGKPAPAIAGLQALLASRTLDARGAGKAWNILGLAYEDQGDLQLARHAYEESLRILEPLPDIRDYAMALDDFGRLYLAAGQLDDAEKIRTKALGLYEKVQYHGGIARASIDLAAISFREKKMNRGNRYLERAVKEARAANDLDGDDRAAIASLQGLQAQFNGDYTLSTARFRQSLDLWRKLHGEEHPITGWGYLLLGEADAAAGHLTLALSEIKQSIAILDGTLGRQNPRYLLAELAYARVLDATGSHREAVQIKSAAEPQLKDIYRKQCAGCTVSAMAFR